MSARRGVLLVLFLLLVAMFVSAGALLLVAIASGPPPTVPANAALYLDLNAPFNEVEPSDVFSQFIERPPTLAATIAQIRQAAADARIKALVIKPQVSGALWAQIQDVRAAIADFRAAGKPVTAYLEAGGAQEYYLASAADRVVMMPAGQLDLSGLATYELFFRGALDKLGVYPDLLHVGDYKTASNTFTEKSFTAAHREMSASLNRDWYNELVRALAASRKKSEAEIRALIDNGPYLADGALKAGLVDQLAYEDQIDDDAPLAGTRRLDEETWARVPAPSRQRVPDAKIAVLYAVGTIASGKSVFDSPTGMILGSQTFAEWVRKVRIDPSVRAVVVRIDSPGGSAIASEVIWRELMLTREVKPVVVSMGDVAASGGYYIAAPAHVIVAEPGTLTGSIGIVTGKFVLGGALDKLGVGTGTVSDGQFADIYSPFTPFTPAERTRVEDQMQATYELFLSRVAEGRHSTTAKIDAIGQGRVWTGHQARELGLVDEIGGLDAAIKIAKQRAKLDPAKDVDLVVYPPRRSFYQILANPFGSSAAAGLEIFFRRPDARMLDAAVSTLQRFRRGEPLALMPNVFLN